MLKHFLDSIKNQFLVYTQSPGIQMAKGTAAMFVYTTKECNYNSIVIVYQHGYDVTYKPRIGTIVSQQTIDL